VKSIILIGALWCAAGSAAAQEPPPQAAPDAPQPPVTTEELLAAIAQVRSAFDTADEHVRVAIETAEARPQQLVEAEGALDRLVQDMDALLAILPEPPS
jgi:hypothetical protein